MIWRNTLLWTPEGIEWRDSEFPPDQWYKHEPRPNAGVEKVSVPVHEDLEQRAKQLVLWVITESLLDQLFRAPQISEEEYFLVHEYTKMLTKEVGFILKPPFSPYDFPVGYAQAWWCWQGDWWTRYPQPIVDHWKEQGWKLNPSFPWNDPRHAKYSDYDDWRRQVAQAEAEKPPVVIREKTF